MKRVLFLVLLVPAVFAHQQRLLLESNSSGPTAGSTARTTVDEVATTGGTTSTTLATPTHRHPTLSTPTSSTPTSPTPTSPTSTSITPTSSTLTSSTPTSPTPITTRPVPINITTAALSGEVCRDKIDTCSHYGKVACTETVYEAWAKDKCALYCGFCAPELLITDRCFDRVGNCNEYDDGRLCTEPQYYGWAYDNCKLYCKFDECNVTDCDDNPKINCQGLDQAVSICSDVQKARHVCKKFCNLCDIADCRWGDWSEWSGCAVTCGTGLLSRNRTLIPEVHGGLPCNGSALDIGTCTLEPCPVDGGWSSWNTWSECSVDCGVGLQHRDRNCSNPRPAIGGDHCFGQPAGYKICVGNTCPNGMWSSWNEWSTCGASGRRFRNRKCTNPTVPLMRLTSCPGAGNEEQVCNIYLANPVVHCVNACTNDVGGVRLCGGVNTHTCSPRYGRVEVFNNGTWGSVCDQGWTTTAATVVCHMFGHTSGSARSTSYYHSGTGPVVLTNVTCLGSEPSLQQCPFNGWVRGDNSSCPTGHDSAGVYCS